MDEWFENYAKIKVRHPPTQTYRGYIDNPHQAKHQEGSAGKLTSLELQKFYKKLLTMGELRQGREQTPGKGPQSQDWRNIHQIIASAMKLAKEQKIIAADPTEGCALPKPEHQEMKTLPVEQLTSFLREAKDSGVFEMYYVELATGLRRGELLGLKWEDLDFEHENLRIKRQIARINGEIVEAPLKTKNAYRTLPLAEDTIAVLKQQKKKVGSSHWVFPSPTGGLISPDSVIHMLHRVLKRAGLPRVRFHDLRHTFATLALQNGVDIKTVSGMLGHFSAGFTLDTYAHVTTAAQKEAARTMEKVLTAAL
ncbi:site-specific integrase [Dysosmobacter welbionis]|uniref:site-specific integrase n=1 Tax=Dysosmobacter welbionis TaxID=2093857 RepID=UPI002357999A|nr:site-specific integrase [Dysosmobacter welbionis]